MKYSIYLLSAGLEFFFAVISLLLLAGCLLDHERKRRVNRLFILILILHALMNIADAFVWLWCDLPERLALVKALSFLSYALGISVIVLFSLLVVCYLREYAYVPAWVTRMLNAVSALALVMWFISLFNDMYYYWNENGVCQYGALYGISQAFGIFFLAFNIELVLVYRKAIPKRDCVVLMLYNAIPLVSYAFIPLWDVVPLYMASTISLLMYYTAIHVEHGQRMAQQQAQLARQELELYDSRTAVMLTQIQPHFLYNTLTAIAQLCEKNPKQAKETTLYFSEYLRGNLNALNQKKPIPFEKELEHVRTYLAIEQVRFADALTVEYDIKATDFALPPLCLQPLIENAVKHGVGMKENGGTITISTTEMLDSYEIKVEDDGVGFDPEKPPADGKSHIGVQSVRERLEKMASAQLSITSVLGSGTTVAIHIPKKGQDA